MKARELFSVVFYSYRKKVLSKGFIIMHLTFIGIFLIMMGIGIAISFSIESSGVTPDSIVVITDDDGYKEIFNDIIRESPSFKKYDLKNQSFYDSAMELVNNKTKQALIQIHNIEGVPQYNITTYDYSNTNLINEIKNDLIIFNQKIYLEEYNIDPGTFYSPEVSQTVIDNNAQSQSEIKVMTIIATAIILLVSMICFPALTVISNDIIYEKSDRTIELIVSSVSTKNLYISKILVGLLLVLTEVLIIIILGLIGIITITAFSQIPAFSGILTVISAGNLIGKLFVFGLYLTLMLLLYLMFVIILSSLTADIETAGYLLLLAVLPMTVLSYMGLSIPYNPSNSVFTLILTYLPLASGFALPVKIMFGLTSTTELIISTSILIITIIVVYFVGKRIFSKNIIKYSLKKRNKTKKLKAKS